MKLLKPLSIFIVCAAILLTGCEGQEDSLVDSRLENNPIPDQTVTASQGSADFSKYVAIGNSITAGLMDAALYNDGQESAFANLLSQQLEIAVMSDGATFDSFDQPDINSENGFNISVPNPDPQTNEVPGRFVLDTSIPGPVPTMGEPIEPFTGDKASLNNFGVPGIVVGQLLTPATGGPNDPQNPAFNPFYQRFATSPGSSTILGDAIATQPTFFTLWIGNNDVLGYALSGASNEAIFTSENDFETQFNAVVNNLLSNTSAEGVVANIPPILALPVFQAVPYNPIPLDEATAQQLNAAYTDYNNGLQQAVAAQLITQQEADRRTINFMAGDNAFVLEDENLTDLSGLGLPPLRQSETTDLVLLSAGSVLGTDLGNGPVGLQDPVGDNLVLTPEEQGAIQQRSIAFNTTIASAVAANSDRLVLYDTNNPSGAFFDLFGLDGSALGISLNGVTLQPDFSPNGVFSTDGVHPNPRGHALLTNEIIDLLENNYGAEIPKVDVLDLPSVVLAQ
jgi:lysophospholipase L1-like esterase